MSPVLFAFVSAALAITALGVILIKNTVHAAFSLVAAFGCVAVLYLMLDADFVAMAQILVYAGAIVIMLLFALMLTQRKDTVLMAGPAEGRGFVAGLVSTLLFVAFVRVLATSPWGSGDHSASVIGSFVSQAGGTPMTLGKEFFSTFLLPFEVVSVLLLMALVGAIVLARKDDEENVKRAVVPKADDAQSASARETVGGAAR